MSKFGKGDKVKNSNTNEVGYISVWCWANDEDIIYSIDDMTSSEF